MQALLNVDPVQRSTHSHWTVEEKQEILETVLFWLELPDPSEVTVEFLQNRAIRIHYEGLADLHWEEMTYRRFGMMLQESDVRRVWFG
ncbi:MAG: hypothetical protein Q7S00_04530 [bacterium]|nr:hypothetical protein [bacterium]